MSSLFSVDFDNGLLFDPGIAGKGFDIISVSGGTLAVSSAAAYSGGYGLAATPSSGYICGGARIIHNPASGKFRQAFWFHPNSITITSGHYLKIARNYHYDLSQEIYGLTLTWNGSSYAIEAAMSDNTLAATAWSSDYTITNAWHLIECYWQSGAPGSFQLWIDGSDKETITQTNNLAWIITPGIGCNLRTTAATASGTVYFDRWRANDDGAVIGA